MALDHEHHSNSNPIIYGNFFFFSQSKLIDDKLLKRQRFFDLRDSGESRIEKIKNPAFEILTVNLVTMSSNIGIKLRVYIWKFSPGIFVKSC